MADTALQAAIRAALESRLNVNNYQDLSAVQQSIARTNLGLGTATVPLIAGTQSSPTSEWVGKSDSLFKVEEGTSILYWLPISSTDTPVTLKITLADGSEATGRVYWSQDERVTTQYPAGSVIGLTYKVNPDNGEGATGWYVLSKYTDTNTEYFPLDADSIDGVFASTCGE